jgi:hypothetical protein
MYNRLLPSWMFIQWMPQMLAALSEPAGALYHRILVRYDIPYYPSHHQLHHVHVVLI